jgi:hypothetical protein
MRFLVFDKKFCGPIFCKLKKNSGPKFRLLVIAMLELTFPNFKPQLHMLEFTFKYLKHFFWRVKSTI